MTQEETDGQGIHPLFKGWKIWRVMHKIVSWPEITNLLGTWIAATPRWGEGIKNGEWLNHHHPTPPSHSHIHRIFHDSSPLSKLWCLPHCLYLKWLLYISSLSNIPITCMLPFCIFPTALEHSVPSYSVFILFAFLLLYSQAWRFFLQLSSVY